MKKVLEWFVYKEDFNNKTIVKFNIFNHSSFVKDLRKAKINFRDNFESFSKRVDELLHYYFWSKCEYEVIIAGWPTTFIPDGDIKTQPSGRLEGVQLEIGEKVDIYDQVTLNWDAFIKYIWENKDKIK